MDDDDTHVLTLQEWAFKYRGSAVAGLLSLLLILGRFTHQRVSSSRLAASCPHALFAGAQGLLIVVLLEVGAARDRKTIDLCMRSARQTRFTDSRISLFRSSDRRRACGCYGWGSMSS